MDENKYMERLRAKWIEIPTSRLGRQKATDLMKLSDAELVSVWENSRRDITTGRQFDHRGWYHDLYKEAFRGKKAIDFGCGFGIDGITFAQNGARVTFVDIVPENLDLVRRLCGILNVTGCDFVLMQGLQSLRALDSDYDAVLAMGSLHHAPFEIVRDEAHELLRRLKTGGRWLQLAYPRARWERDGMPPFDKWGEITDGPGTPWAEWINLTKLKRLLLPARFEVVFTREFHNSDFVWFDLKIRDVRGEPEQDDRPLVSVVVPCLNRAEFLSPTIESILDQDYAKIECIVVDGGSDDGSVDVLRGYGGTIRWVSEPDRGHADAINKGWKMSSGQILAWLNADDLWRTPEAVKHAVDFMQAHPDVEVAYGNCDRINTEGNRIGHTYLMQWDLEYAVEYCDHCIPQPAAFILRTALERVGWLDISFIQKKDHELWLRIGLEGKIKYLPVPIASQRDIRGLSFDGKTAAPACIQVTRKFYSLPNVPEAIRQKKQRALSNSYLRGVDYAFVGGRHWGIILVYTIRAVLSDPTNAIDAIARLWLYINKGLQQLYIKYRTKGDSPAAQGSSRMP